jgi:hypothetical protein
MPRFPLLLLPLLTLIGCAQNTHPNLPGGSKLVAEAPAPWNYTAPEKGTLYLYDAASKQVLFIAPLNPNQKIAIDATAGRITVNGATIPAASHSAPDAQYQLFFKPATQREYHPVYNP